jgi:hypothetical protein
MNPQKRKRPVVSYAQLDPLADLLNDDEDITVPPNDESSDDESDNDDRTYSRRNVCILGPRLHKSRSTHCPTQKKPKKTPKKKARHTAIKHQKAEKPFPFMDLPPELRDMIYEMALTDEDGMSIVAKTKAYRRTVRRAPIYDPEGDRYIQRATGRGKPKKQIQDPEEGNQSPPLVPNLLAVSKQIHTEAVNILYNQDFMFQDTDALHRFLTIIGPRNQQRLHSIDIKNFCQGRNTRTLNHCAFMSLAGATNLKTLHLNSAEFRSWYSGAKGFARGLYSNMHSFLEAYGVANGRRDAALDIIQMDQEIFDCFYTHRFRHGTFTKQPSMEENKVLFRAELCRLLGAK